MHIITQPRRAPKRRMPLPRLPRNQQDQRIPLLPTPFSLPVFCDLLHHRPVACLAVPVFLGRGLDGLEEFRDVGCEARSGVVEGGYLAAGRAGDDGGGERGGVEVVGGGHAVEERAWGFPTSIRLGHRGLKE